MALELVQAAPDDPEAWYALGRVALTLGRRDEAESALGQVLERNPNDLDALKGLLVIVSYEPESTAWASWERRLLEVAPTDPDVLCTIGAARETQGDLAEAERYYRRALQQDGKHPIASYNLAVLVHQQQGLEAARALFRVFVEHAPRFDSRIARVQELLAEPEPPRNQAGPNR